jgi:chemotaxis protein MotA
MVVILGLIIVIVGVLGGFVMAGGPLFVLVQLPEFIIMGAAAIGSLLIGTPYWLLKRMPAKIGQLLKGDPYTQKVYLNLLQTMYELFIVSDRAGLMSMETHVEQPKDSSIFKKNSFLMSHDIFLNYICDTLKLTISGGVSEQELEYLLDADIETHHEEMSGFSITLSKVGDALPGLGIVAAVLGIIITMGSIGGSPESVGEKVAAALVGTFIGVLASYGFVSPIANGLEFNSQSEQRYMMCIKTAIVAYTKGNGAIISTEIARRAIYSHVKPSFQELEEACHRTRAALKTPMV